jgi:glycosyltransferase involved in cell wall biosynthesis
MPSAEQVHPRRRVVVVAHSLVASDGGMETVHVRLIEEMLDRVDVVALTCRLDPRLEGRVELRQVKVPTSPAPLRFALFFLVASMMLSRLRRDGDVVHTCGAIVAGRVDVASIHTLSAAIVAARDGRLAAPGATLPRRINSGLLRWMALRAERHCYRPRRLGVAAAVSQVTRDEVERFYPDVDVVVTPNGVDPERYHPDPSVRPVVRAELGIPDDAVVALFVGGDFERKGLGLAIESLVAAPAVHLVAAGPGDLQRARDLARSLDVDDRVHLLGARSDVERLDQAADLYLCASLYEADSLALLEAAASGLAIVSTRVGSAEAFVGSGDAAAGILVDRTAESIGAGLEALASDPLKRQQHGARALEASMTRRWSAIATQVLGLYDRYG